MQLLIWQVKGHSMYGRTKSFIHSIYPHATASESLVLSSTVSPAPCPGSTAQQVLSKHLENEEIALHLCFISTYNVGGLDMSSLAAQFSHDSHSDGVWLLSEQNGTPGN